MSALSVQIDRIGASSHYLESGSLLPQHKKRLETELSKNLSKNRSPDLAFHVDLHSTPDWNEATRTARYYQHMGLLPKGQSDPKTRATCQRTAKVAVQSMQQASIPGTNGQLLAGARIADDTLSVTRNILCALPSVGADSPIVSNLGFIAGSLWAFFAVREVEGGVVDIVRAQEIEDREGARRAGARIVSGGIVSTASVGYLTGKVFETVHLTNAASTAFSFCNILFGLGAILAMGSSFLGWLRCYRFEGRLREYLEHPTLPEVQKFQGALRFLKETLAVTPEEIAHIRHEVDLANPQMSTEDREKLIEKKITDLAETKVKYLKRRTSIKSLQLIANKVDSILVKIHDEKTSIEGIKEATELLKTIQNENSTKMALFTMSFVAATICFAAMLVMQFITGALGFILYGIGSTIYLGLSIYSYAGMCLPKQNIENLPAEQNAHLPHHHSIG